jgi:hypothetical protein
MKPIQTQRFMLLCTLIGIAAVAAHAACLADVCAPEEKSASYLTLQEVEQFQIETLKQGLERRGSKLKPGQATLLAADGQLFGVVPDRPVKHPNGSVEMPAGWLPEIPAGHPWLGRLTPSDNAFYSFVEERIIKARLYDPRNPEHAEAVTAYLKKANSSDPAFPGWTAIGGRKECPKKVFDAAGTGPDVDPNL